MPPDPKGQIEAQEIHHVKGLSCKTVVIRSFKHDTGDNMIWLLSTPILRERTESSHFSSHSNNFTRELAARRMFRLTPCRKGTIHLQAFMPSPGFKPRSYGRAVIVTNHYTGWVD
ncbi:hypothetical protein TNCV_5137961 [Trichonephila clavipes]|nr:hypothetical protein TNCV_5137961 [Trichonephila clavipes]